MVNNNGFLMGLLMINGYHGFIHGYLAGGDWNMTMAFIFPIILGMECHHPNISEVHHFSEGLVG